MGSAINTEGAPHSAVRMAGSVDRERVATMLARAFADDPGMSWIFPDPEDRARRLVRLFALLFDEDAAGMRLVAGEGAAATLWRAPGMAKTGTLRLLGQARPLWRALGSKIPRALSVSNAVETHMPTGDFWYLHLAGCDPAAQGRGLGGLVVRAGLQRVAGRFPAYLETSTERNLGFYGAIGFQVTKEWRVPGGGPRFWSMMRQPDPLS
ncbi:GNAT family N-acetyltransferase [Sphingomonas sp.]|uniref:GNAT family N-acetyltransferase n=1 Tax=Sphingomonas sp. TaxID=28214 RepID=UPI002A397D0E|nr:family N-acetyltransferase [Sphingomonas sp.]